MSILFRKHTATAINGLQVIIWRDVGFYANFTINLDLYFILCLLLWIVVILSAINEFEGHFRQRFRRQPFNANHQ